MIRVAWVRGAYLNNFEGQNYLLEDKEIHLTGISSRFPIDDSVSFPLIRLTSPADFSSAPFLRRILMVASATKYISNRLIGDSQLLMGLERLAPSFDIFHTADPHYYYSYQLARLRAERKIRYLIVTSWETIAFNNESVSGKRHIKRYVLQHADQFICYTKRAAEALNREGIAMKKITVLPLGIDLSVFTPAEQPPDTATILFVGRLVEEKGILDLYEAFSGMRNSPARLRIVGKGPLKQRLLRSAAKDGIADRITIEELPYTSMPDVFRSSTLFVLPSRTTSTWEEQYGMVLAEAMASGLPVISTSTGAIQEVTGDAAVSVDAGDVRGIRRAMRRIVTDQNERDRLGAASTLRAKQYLDSRKTAKIIGTIYTEIYEKISHLGSRSYP